MYPERVHDPSLLPDDDTWCHRCPQCPPDPGLITQGGAWGIVKHFEYVHPDSPMPTEDTRLPAPEPTRRRRLKVVPAPRPQSRTHGTRRRGCAISPGQEALPFESD